MALLEVTDIHSFYGNIEALKGISLTVEEGEIVTLIGSNGAGKSTTLRSISGLTPPRSGSIKFDGKELGETPPQEIVRLGISILLIEHDMKVVMGVSEYVTVLNYGEKLTEGDPHSVRNDPLVVEAYLGKDEAERQRQESGGV